jgi:hypothetical protein
VKRKKKRKKGLPNENKYKTNPVFFFFRGTKKRKNILFSTGHEEHVCFEIGEIYSKLICIIFYRPFQYLLKNMAKSFSRGED